MRLYPHTQYGESGRQWLARKLLRPYKKEPPLSGPRDLGSFAMARKRSRSSVAVSKLRGRSRSRSLKPRSKRARRRTRSRSAYPTRRIRRAYSSVGRYRSASRPPSYISSVAVYDEAAAYRSMHRRGKETLVSAGGGIYAGSMNRNMHKKRAWTEKFNRYGVVEKNERTATTSDDNCVYAVCDVIAPAEAIYYTIGALLRKLFEKAGFRPGGFSESPLGTKQPGNEMNNMQVVLSTHNAVTGGFAQVNAGIGTLTSFADIIALLVPTFQDYVAQFGISSASNGLELTHLTLEKYFTIDAAEERVVLSTLQLNECELTVFGEAELKVQNRTPSSSGSTDAENVTANPIIGRSYIFSGIPKVKTYANVIGQTLDSTFLFGFLANGNGLGVFGATNAATEASFKTPPEPGTFWNCQQSGKVYLDPGNVKALYHSYYKKCNVLKFLQKMKFNVNTGYYGYTIFPCMMVAFEDMINLENSNDITIAVAVERYLGCMVTEKRRKWMKSNFDTSHA